MNSSTEACSSFTVIYPDANTTEPTVSFSSNSQSQHPQATSANSNGSSTSTSSTNNNNNPNNNNNHRPTYFPIWLRLSRLIFGKIRRLPRSMSTTLVLFGVQIYLTVPVIIVCGLSYKSTDLKALLRPFRYIKEQGFLFEELGEQFCELL